MTEEKDYWRKSKDELALGEFGLLVVLVVVEAALEVHSPAVHGQKHERRPDPVREGSEVSLDGIVLGEHLASYRH